MILLAHIIFILGTFGLGVYTGKKLAAKEPVLDLSKTTKQSE